MTKEQKENIQAHLDRLASSNDEMVPMSEVRQIIDAVRDMFEGNFQGEDLSMLGELGELARAINRARKELREFSPQALNDEHLPNASEQLDTIVKTTEQATGKIMDNCERLTDMHLRIKERIAGSSVAATDPDLLASLDDAMTESQSHITEIFEACNFQDLTGQRIQKIVKTLREVERQVLRMVIVFGLHKDKGKALDSQTKEKMMSDADLLNGPALPGQSMEQEDIDDILDKLL
jgi:chemotaxis protein CheZ